MIIKVKKAEKITEKRKIELSSNSVEVLLFFMEYKEFWMNKPFISKKLKMNISTVHDCIIDLQAVGLIEKASDRKFYRYVPQEENIKFVF